MRWTTRINLFRKKSKHTTIYRSATPTRKSSFKRMLRKSSTFRSRFLLLFLTLIALAARAEDWPQFRGPTGQGHSIESGLPFQWSESRNVKWKTPDRKSDV